LERASIIVPSNSMDVCFAISLSIVRFGLVIKLTKPLPFQSIQNWIKLQPSLYVPQ